MAPQMKAISLYQPYATLWGMGVKVHETRSWLTQYRGWLAVHAGCKSYPLDQMNPQFRDLCAKEFDVGWHEDLPRGCIVGLVHLDNCSPVEIVRNRLTLPDFLSGDYSDRRYAWHADQHTLLKDTVPYRGFQRIFNLDEVTSRKLEREITEAWEGAE